MLGDVLELLHTCTDRWTTVRWEGRGWSDAAVIERGRVAFEREAGAGPRTRPPGVDRPVAAHEHDPTVLARSDGWVRIERPGAHGEVRRVEAPDGRCVSTSASGRVFAQDGPAPPTVRQLRAGVVPVLLDPSLLLSTYRLEAMGTKTVAGRDAFDVRAVARTVVPVPPLGRGVDAARLAVDATTGLLTFAETTIGGDVAERVEAVRLVVDEALDDDTFDLTAPAGAVPHMIESIGVEELARRIQALDEPDRFTLEAPAEGDDARSWRGWLARPGGDARPFAVLHAAAPGQRRFVSLHEAASPGAMPDTGEWEPVTIDGDDARRWVADEGCDVVLRRGATWVWVRNCATYDDAVTLVRRLRAVSPA